MLLSETEPFVRQALHARLTRHNTYDLFSNLRTVDHRMFYITAGSGEMEIAGKVYPLAPGTAILFPAGTEYVWRVEDVWYYVINFDYTQKNCGITKSIHPFHADTFREDEILEHIAIDDAPETMRPIVVHNALSLENRMQLLTSEFPLGGRHTSLLLSSLVKSLIISFVQLTEEANSPAEGRDSALVRSIIAYIHEQYAQPLSNEDIARQFHFSSAYIGRVFHRLTGVSLHEYLLTYRLDEARELLRTQNIPIGEIANRTGFPSAAHFSKTFRRRFGITPGEYRSI